MLHLKSAFRKNRFVVPVFVFLLPPAATLLFFGSSDDPRSTGRRDQSPHGSGIDWGHDNDIKVSDNRTANVDLEDSDSSDYLVATKFNFSIPV